MGLFDGKRALVLGVANKRSIAWGIAKRLADGGATLAFTFQGERIESSVRDLAESVDSPLVTSCDVRSDEDARPALALQGLGELGSDPARAAGDHGDAVAHDRRRRREAEPRKAASVSQ